MSKLIESSLPQKGCSDAKTRITNAVIEQANSLENPEETTKT